MRGCLEDLLQQTLYKQNKLEIIVIDSASPENEEDIVRDYQVKYPHIKYLRTPQSEGLYQSWNRGIQVAKGKFITNANTDDRHDTHCLELLSDSLKNNPNIDLVYGNIYRSIIPNETFDESKKRTKDIPQEYFGPSLLLHYYYGCQPMWRKELHDKIGYFSDKLEAIGDYEFALRLAENGYTAKYVPEAEGLMLWHSKSISSRSSIPLEEREALFRDYHTTDKILAIYQKATNALALRSDKSDQTIDNEYWLDLSLRAICYYPHYKEGKSESNLKLSQFGIQHLTDDLSYKKQNNQGVLEILSGRIEEGLSLLKNSAPRNEVITRNLENLERFIQNKKKPLKLDLYGSSLPLPLEQDLKPNAKVVYIKPNTTDRDFIYTIDTKQYWNSIVGIIDFERVKTCKDVYIWGANNNSRVLLDLCKFEGVPIKKLVDNDLNKRYTYFHNTRVIHPDDLAEQDGIAHFIIASGPRNWSSITNTINSLPLKSIISYPSNEAS